MNRHDTYQALIALPTLNMIDKAWLAVRRDRETPIAVVVRDACPRGLGRALAALGDDELLKLTEEYQSAPWLSSYKERVAEIRKEWTTKRIVAALEAL